MLQRSDVPGTPALHIDARHVDLRLAYFHLCSCDVLHRMDDALGACLSMHFLTIALHLRAVGSATAHVFCDTCREPLLDPGT